MSAEWPTMPASAETGYQVYATSGGRSISETARILGTPRKTVDSWALRYRWRDRVASEDIDERDAAIAGAYARMARILPQAVGVLADAVGGSDVPRGQLQAAFGVLDRFGVSPIQRAALDVRTRASSAAIVSDADLDRMLRAGDVATLLALASGRPLPQADSLPALPSSVDPDDAGADGLPHTLAAGRQDISREGER